MKTNLIIILIGLVSAFIGIVPLLNKKADRYSLFAALLNTPLYYVIFSKTKTAPGRSATRCDCRGLLSHCVGK